MKVDLPQPARQQSDRRQSDLRQRREELRGDGCLHALQLTGVSGQTDHHCLVLISAHNQAATSLKEHRANQRSRSAIFGTSLSVAKRHPAAS